MKTILVTGVNGFVGRHLSRELAAHNYKVTGVGGTAGATAAPDGLADYLVLDLNDATSVEGIDFAEIAGVLHLAGLAAVGPSFDEPRQYIESNMGMEINLFEAARKQGATPKFVIVSSGSLYDARAPLPLTEESPVAPTSPYAVSKLGQEQMAQYYTSRGFEVVIARPFNHIGPGQNTGFIVPDIASQIVAFEGGEAKEILVGNLEAKRDYTDVRDIARAYRLLFETGTSGEIYNICSGMSVSGTDMLAHILAAANSTPPTAQEPSKMRPSDAPDIYGSHNKLTRDTGWMPEIPLQQTLTNVLADWRSRT